MGVSITFLHRSPRNAWVLVMGTRVYLWRIHVDIWQNQYNIVKFKKKRKEKKE